MSEMTSALGNSRKRALGYGRVSTRRQADHAVSLEEQQGKIVSCCDARQSDLVKTFVDRGLTGKIDGRPEFQQMIEFAEDPNNRIELVVVYSMSRFFRNVRHFLNYKERLNAAGVKLISATQEIPDGPTGALMETIIAAVDGHQSDVNAGIVRDVMAGNAEAGFWNGSRPPFGYQTIVDCVRAQKQKKKLAVLDDEAAIVRIVFDLYLGRHDSTPALGIKEIVNYLNSRGTTHRGHKFYVSNVEKILKRTTYYGEHFYNRTDSVAKKPRPQSEWVKVDVPAIISRADFDAVQNKLRANRPSETPPQIVSGPSLLVGLAKCDLCGGAMTLRTGKSGRYKYLTCCAQATKGKTACEGQSIRMDFVDEIVLSEVEAKVFQPDRLGILLDEMFDQSKMGRDGAKEELIRLREFSKSVRSQQKRLYEMVAKGLTDLDDPALKGAIEDLKLKLVNIENAVALVERRLAIQPIDVDQEKLQAFSTAVRNRLRDGNPAFRRDWLRLFVNEVIISPDEIRIIGPKERLFSGVVSGGSGRHGPVPSFDREWRTRRDSNPWPLPSEGRAGL